jgi:hypothetical protein
MCQVLASILSTGQKEREGGEGEGKRAKGKRERKRKLSSHKETWRNL